MRSIERKILDQIQKMARGRLFFPTDFNHIGSSESIRISLHRLAKAGKITRVKQGVYVRPKESELIGKLIPTAEEVATAIIKKQRLKAIPSGSFAMNALGLSTQVPTKLVMLSDGSPRRIKIGKTSILIKKTSQKLLQLKGKISRLAVLSLKEIGYRNLTEIEETKIIALLKKEDPVLLRHDIDLAPIWIQKIMKKALVNG
jgi:hypothetical protein